jgi:hypothetical protein
LIQVLELFQCPLETRQAWSRSGPQILFCRDCLVKPGILEFLLGGKNGRRELKALKALLSTVVLSFSTAGSAERCDRMGWQEFPAQ